MLSPDYIRDMCRKLRRIAQDMEDDEIAAIIAMLYGMEQTDTINMVEVTNTMTRITEMYRVMGIREIRRIIRDAFEENVRVEQRAYREAERAVEESGEKPGGGAGQSPWGESGDIPRGGQRIGEWNIPKIQDPYFRNIVESVDRQTEGTWNNITRTQAYNGVNRYVNAVDQATLETMTGEKPWNKARQDAIDKLVDEGIPNVTSGTSGRTESAAVAAERNTRTAVSRMSGDIILEMAKQNGINLVLVSAHYGARPTHRPWQGKVFSIVGATDKYKDFYKETEYGTMLGLCGINCRHSFSAFVEGMHNPYEGKEEEYNDPKRYDDEQRQRALERKIRHLRREKRALQAIPKEQRTDADKADLRAVSKALKDAIQEYEEFCQAHDFRPLWERTRD